MEDGDASVPRSARARIRRSLYLHGSTLTSAAAQQHYLKHRIQGPILIRPDPMPE